MQSVTYLPSLNSASRYFNCENVELFRIQVILEIHVENYDNVQTYVQWSLALICENYFPVSTLTSHIF